MSQRVTEAELLARIERGERVESPEEMTEAYRDNLVHLMTMQADSARDRFRKIRARFRNGALVPLDPLDLPEGSEVEILVRPFPKN